MLKQFKIDTNRDLLAPDFSCYQLNLKPLVDKILDQIEDEDFKNLPSWSKFCANPVKAKGFYINVLKAMFMGIGDNDELNIDYQLNRFDGSPRIAMMFMAGSTTNVALEVIGKIARETLDAFEVITLFGSERYNGKKITNKSSESIVKEVVEKASKEGKSVLIISARLAQRSFSIPEITELYLAYDEGQIGATIQKMSRVLTPSGRDKVGKVFSLSFDPNRDDKFDAMIVETAINISQRKNIESLYEAMRLVLRTIDIFNCTPDGAVQISVDEYLEVALANKRISRILGKITDLSDISEEELKALANCDANYFKMQKQEKSVKGKTRENIKQRKKSDKDNNKEFQKLVAKAKEKLVEIYENLDVIILGTKTTDIDEAFRLISNNKMYQDCVEEEFGIGYEVIQYLFDRGIIKKNWIDLLHKYGTSNKN